MDSKDKLIQEIRKGVLEEILEMLESDLPTLKTETMPDKLTDSEIVSLLKCCSKSNCYNCGYNKQCDGYTSANYALDLINRLQAEIERLKKGWKADVILTANAKAEAYKEFAERLKVKAMAKYKTTDNEYLYEFDNNFIDNLLKELVGDAK